MAKLRKGVCYRKLERPYTRISKYREESYVKARPHIVITKFDMGYVKGDYDYVIDLIAKEDFQIRQQSIESARKAINKILERKVGSNNFHFKILKFPHHILRENPISTGAGADRLSTGMKLSFGKSIGVAVQIKKGEPLIRVLTFKRYSKAVREALKVGKTKLPYTWSIQEKSLKIEE